MKKILSLTVAFAMSMLAGSALAADKVTLQLKWVAQAQFAGYFVAKDKGFYKDAGLDVEINGPLSSINRCVVVRTPPAEYKPAPLLMTCEWKSACERL